MTTVDTAAAWQARRPVATLALLVATSLGLAGCETGNNLLASPGPSTSLAEQTAPAPAAKKLATIAVAPIIGAPEAIAKQLQTQLTAAAEKQGFALVKSPQDKLDYTLRGYIVSAREKSGSKVSYIWDVTDPAGRRINRITGEEVVTGAESKDPWAQVSAAVTQTIADKTAVSLASWVPTQTGTLPVATAPANPGALGGPQVAAATPAAATATDAARGASPASPTTASATTGSIASGSIAASVPSVVGAPGDGSVSLTSALQKELTKNGVSLSDASAGASAYKVEGRVKVGETRDGKQPITIDWDVKDPKGKKLGTVSQKNEIPQGSLDGPWGKTADAAAAAAAQGILKLLPNQKAAN